METYLLGYGFALVLALLSWSDKFKDLQNETQEVEKEFAEKKQVNYRKIRMILSQQKGISLSERISSLTEFLKGTTTEKEIENTISIIHKFQELFDLSVQLGRSLQFKFKLVVILAIYFIVSGAAACLISNKSFLCIFGLRVLAESLFIIPLIPFFLFLVLYLLILNRKELNYRKKIFETLELF